MVTQSRKQEALALLALDKMSDEQEDVVNRLTLLQMGWRVIKQSHSSYFEVYSPDLAVPLRMDFTTETSAWRWMFRDYDFVWDVNACLRLPFDHYVSMRMLSNRQGESGWEVVLDDFATTIEAWSKSLPIAMLIAWWKAQED